MAHGIIAQTLGLRDSSTLSTGSFALNASTSRLLLTFAVANNVTLSKVRFYLATVTGTLGANDIVCALHAMPTGSITASTAPDSSLESRNTVTATPTGAGWVEVTGFTTALTAGTLYGLVISNANGTPASNYFTVRWTTGSETDMVGTSAAWGWGKRHSTDSGSSYAGGIAGIAGLRLEFSDGSVVGWPASDGAALPAGDGVYSTRESGALFTTPADAYLRVKGIGARVLVTGSPTGQPRFRLYEGTSLLGTTEAAPQWGTQNILWLPFATTLVLDPSTAHRVVLGETTQSDTSGNRFNLYSYTIENDANSKALMPLGGWVKTYYDGSSWTDTDTAAPIIFLILEKDDPFDAVGGGGASGGGPLIGSRLVR